MFFFIYTSCIFIWNSYKIILYHMRVLRYSEPIMLSLYRGIYVLLGLHFQNTSKVYLMFALSVTVIVALLKCTVVIFCERSSKVIWYKHSKEGNNLIRGVIGKLNNKEVQSSSNENQERLIINSIWKRIRNLVCFEEYCLSWLLYWFVN